MTSQLTSRTNILIVDAHPAARETIAATLATQLDIQSVQAASASLASAILLGKEPRIDAVMLGADLQDQSGPELCQNLRRQGIRLPILLMTVAPTEAEIVAGLDAGANDIIALPHRRAEMLARLRAHLRCHAWCDDVTLQVGPYQFRPSVRLLTDTEANRRIRLTDKETAVLKFLHRAGGVPVGRRALLREVWGYAPGASTHTVETHIYRLRRKIEPDANQIMLLLNDGGGYRLASDWVRPAAPRPRPMPALGAMAMAG